jgi:hypothetical protein
LHSPASMLAFACIVPASMLAYACIRLHRSCIDACACLHRTEPTKGEARRLVRFSDQRIESTCETCDDTRGARTRAHPRPSSVLLRSFVAFSFLPVPPPSSFVLSSPSRFCPSLLRPPSFFPVPSSPALSSARPSSVLLRSFVAFSSFPVPVSLSPWSGALLVS